MTSEIPEPKFSPSDFESAEKALKQRPRFSIRFRITLGFLLTFLVVCAVTVAGIVFISKLGAKQLFIEKAGNYAFEIQQARRFEKNYLLYGTDLYDALSFVNNARNVLRAARQDFCTAIGESAYVIMSENLEHYHDLLEQLGELGTKEDAESTEARTRVQSDLRRSGSELVSDAANAIDQERLIFHSWLHTSKIMAICALAIILLLEIYIVTFIARQIFLPFTRFESYMQRIAVGDFSPVTPVKRFQDEFTDLAVAINRMLQEINDRGNQLVQARKMAAVGTLTAGIAHEINNPLNNISLTTEALIDDFHQWSDEEKLDMLKDISSQVERAGATVANLLDFTRRDQSAFKQVDIGEVITATASLLKNEMLLGHISLDMAMEKELPPVMGNHQNLQQVFLNLFLNAMEAMPGGGTLTVTGCREGDVVRIDIIDTGEGIPEDLLHRIFEPFFTTKDVGKGTGLGLSVSFGIVTMHNGSITAKNRKDGGAVFTVQLPVA